VLTDYDILHIPETKDISIIRKAYRKIVKEIHPDVSDEADLIKNHLLFIQINKAYQRLVGKFGSQDTYGVKPFDSGLNSDSALVHHKDPAYAFYKTAMMHYMKIHPSQWTVETKSTLNKPSSLREEELERIKDKVRNLVSLFPRAYYYFSIVVNEYPNSVWYQDSKEKMEIIEERIVRYRKIIESFTEHDKEVPRVNRMFN
jgi:hypothetical protein